MSPSYINIALMLRQSVLLPTVGQGLLREKGLIFVACNRVIPSSNWVSLS